MELLSSGSSPVGTVEMVRVLGFLMLVWAVYYIYFFISKGANHAGINPAEFGFCFEDKADKDWQQIEFDPKGKIRKNGWFHIAATWEFTTKGKSSQEAYLIFKWGRNC